MTNFERYKEELTMESFIDTMIINCGACPVKECPYRYVCAIGSECEEELKTWCKKET